MPRIKHHRSSRRVPPPKDSDFDHEINLVDRDEEENPLRPSSTAASSSRQQHPPASGAAAPGEVDGEGGPAGEGRDQGAGGPSIQVEEPTPLEDTERPLARTQTAQERGPAKLAEPVIDILYENQRGGFLCGIPLFSCKALGNLDPPPWTNYAHKSSPTDITTAQVPDPSWEWAWPDWRINHDEGADEDGWDYSFAFYKKFSWHKARWYNSFVRRRVWIRKRVQKGAGYISEDPHMLNPEYFSIRPSSELARDRSPSRASSRGGSRLSMSTANMDSVEKPVIEHADDLLRVLRASRIDREKIEAVDNYLDNAQEDLGGLEEIMHDIMSLFVFQASRRVLLTRLTEVYDNMVAQQSKEKDASPDLERKVKNLAAAVKHADEEVRRLEYWSDVKGMAEEGDSKGAVDQKQGWDPAWQGVDRSGPSAPPGPQEASKAGESPGDTGKAT